MITPEELCKIFDYNPETGLLFWKVRNSKRVKIGDVAGHKTPENRVLVGIHGKTYKAHRVIWAIVTGKWPEFMIDHINGDGCDNRLCNLREATKSQNMMNVGIIKSNTSGFRGVGWSKVSQKWRAYIKVGNKDIHLGLFKNIEDAKKARIEAAIKYHGEFFHD
jgi:hypothetical protein